MATHLRAGEHQVAPSISRKPRTEAFVEEQLAKARVRIRLLDLGTAFLGFLILTLAYAFVAALLDRWFDLSAVARRTGFGLYAVGALVYGAFLMGKPLIQRVNPYYAARRLEKLMPQAKNSVINWLDLHQQTISPAFRTAIDHRAAEDLKDVDLDEAITNKRTSWLGSAAAILFLALVIFYVLSPRQFLSLMSRAFSPFESSAIATRTQLSIVKPDGGDATIEVGRAISFLVNVDGRIPNTNSSDALKLLYRYSPNEPYAEHLLQSTPATREWTVALLATEVRTGFWYKVTGGDAQTPEYRVQVRSRPLLVGFDVTYRHRPYLGYADQVSKDPNLTAIRGTRVSMVARTNRTVEDGMLLIRDPKLKTDRTDANGAVKGEKIEGDPQSLRFTFDLDMTEDTEYRIQFRSTENQENQESLPYKINIKLDRPPQVELRKPGQDVELPANGILDLEGSASDDYGLGRLTLQMKMVDGPKLRGKPYRGGKELRQGDGSYPLILDYREHVELDKLINEAGTQSKPRPGDVIEYWLEAADNCDYPSPNISTSKIYRIRLGDVLNKKEQQKKKEDAQREQKKNDEQQDKQLSEQSRQDGNQEKGNDSPKSSDPKSEGHENEGDKQSAGKSSGQDKNPEQNSGQSSEQENAEKRLKQIQDELNREARDKQTPKDQEKGNDKPDSTGTDKSVADKGDSGPKEKGQTGSDNSSAKKNGADNKDKGDQGSGTDKSAADKGDSGSKEKGQTGSDNSAAKKDGTDNKGKGDQGSATDKSAADKGDSGPKEKGQTGSDNSAAKKDGTDNKGKGDQGSATDKSAADKGDSGPKEKGQTSTENSAAKKDGTDNKEKGNQGSATDKSAADKGDPGSKQKGQAGSDNSAAKKDGTDNKGKGDQGSGTDKSTADKGDSGSKEKGQTSTENSAARKDGTDNKGKGDQGSATDKSTADKGDSGPKEKGQAGTENSAAKKDGADNKEKGNQGSATDKSAADKGDSGSKEKGQAGTENSAAKKDGADNKEKGNQGSATDKSAADKGDSGSKEKGQAGSENSAAKKDGTDNKGKGDQGSATDKSAADKGDSGPKEKGQAGTENSAAKKDGADNKGKGDQGSATDKSAADKGDSGPKEKGQAGTENSAAKKDGADNKEKTEQGNSQANPRSGQNDESIKKGLETLKKSLEQMNPEQQAAARKKLEELAKNGTPAEKKAIEDALKQAAKDGRSGQNKPRHSDGTEQRTADGKGDRQPGPAKGAGDKSESTEQAEGGGPDQEKGNANGKPGQSGNGTRPMGSGGSSAKGGGESGRGQPGSAQRPNKDGPVATEQNPATDPDPQFSKKAGDLQLEDIKKRINKDVLNRLNMSEEEFQRLVKAYEQAHPKNPAQPAASDKLAPPTHDKALANSQRVRKVNAGPVKNGTSQRAPQPLPPLEFRDAQQEFSRMIADMQRNQPKK